MSKTQAHILIVDDDQQLRTMLAELLRLEDFKVETASDGVEGLEKSGAASYDLIVLDVMMPRMDGFETLKNLRQRSSCPVIMLTARGEADDRITGLEYGADDYIAKPFNPLKRSLAQHSGEAEVLSAGALVLDVPRMQATLNGHEIALTGAELRVLEALMRSPGRAVSREELNEFALGRALTPYDRAMDTHISNLRGKLKSVSSDDVTIRSLRGEGYVLMVS